MTKVKKLSKSLSRGRMLNFANLIIGTALFVFIFIVGIFAFKPSLSRYPALSSCFKSSVHKIILCNRNPKYVGLNQISKFFIHSVLVSEDDSFYNHQGVDWNEFKKSFLENLKLFRFARGGSTITQQLVKNAYLNQNKSIIRKIKEIILAQQVESKYSKSVILEKYLNIIELGTDIYGIKDAASKYFKKKPSDLNVLESVYLSTLLPNPKLYSKSIHNKLLSKWQKERILKILKRLLQRKRISKQLYENAKSKVGLFPWFDLVLNETKELNDDDLEFLDNLPETKLEEDAIDNSTDDLEINDENRFLPTDNNEDESLTDTESNTDLNGSLQNEKTEAEVDMELQDIIQNKDLEVDMNEEPELLKAIESEETI